MNNQRHGALIVAASASVLLSLLLSQHLGQPAFAQDTQVQSAEQSYPNRPIQVVVPYGAGGGSDTFVRTLQKGIINDNLLESPLVIVNQPGGSATIGSRTVKDADPDGYKILCLHNAIITAKMAGTVDYGVEAFEAIAMTGELSLVIMVREDAPYKDLRDLLDEAKKRPKEVRFGANKGAPAYFATLQMEKVWPGADFNIVSADGGADRYAKVLGGHLDAGIFSLSEYLDFRAPDGTPPDRNVRAIAVMATERHASIPDVPCSAEQGVPVLLSNAHYWWAPKGTPAPVIEKLANAFRTAMQNQEVKSELERFRVDNVFLQGDELQTRLAETIKRFESAVATKESSLPNLTRYVMWIVGALLLWVIVETFTKSATTEPESPFETTDHTPRPYTAAACFAVVLFYVYMLGLGWLPYSVATTTMIFIVGGLMVKWNKQGLTVLAPLALVTGFGTQFVFTEIFETILP